MNRIDLACLIALLALPWSCFGNSLPGRQGRIAMDASEIRVEFPQVFRAAPNDAGRAKPQALAAAALPHDAPPPLSSAPGAPRRDHELRGACERSESAFCYDVAERHAVYRPARQFMPAFQGLRPESMSLHSKQIRFRYSFR